MFDNYPIGNTTVIDHAVIGEGNVESRLAGDFNPVNVMIGYVNGDAGLFSGGAAATTVDEYYAWLEESYGEDAEIMKELYPVESDDEVAAVCNQISYDRMVMAAWAEALMETYSNDKSAFIYFVDHEAPADVPVGMFHTGDIPYWLGGTLVDRAQYETDVDHAMYQTMKGYFENFITKADPNGEGLPQWDEFDGSYKYMLIGDDTYEMSEIPKERGDYWVSVLNSIYEDAVDTACMAMIADEEIGEEIAAEVAEEVLPTVEGSIFVAPLRPENAQALMDLFAVITGEEGESSFDLAMMLVGEEEPTEEEIEALKSELEGFEEALSYGYLTEVGTALIDAGALGLEDGDVVKGVVMIEGKPAVTEAEVVEGVIALEVIEPSVCFMFTDAD